MVGAEPGLVQLQRLFEELAGVVRATAVGVGPGDAVHGSERVGIVGYDPERGPVPRRLDVRTRVTRTPYGPSRMGVDELHQ